MPLQHYPRGVHLCHDNVAGNMVFTTIHAIRAAKLGAPQQDIPGLFAHHPGLKTAEGIVKRQQCAVFTTKAHQLRRHQHIAKAKDVTHRMNGYLQQFFALPLDRLLHQQRFPLLVQIGAIASDIEAVLQFFHSSPSCIENRSAT